MSNILGEICPYCQKPIDDLENAYVCSECGIPHHKNCSNNHSNAINKEETKKEDENCSNASKESARKKIKSSVQCPRCNGLNNPLSTYCCICGSPIYIKDNYVLQNYNNYSYDSQSNYNSVFKNGYAGFWKRFFAALIDDGVFIILSLIFKKLSTYWVLTSIAYWLYYSIFESSVKQATPGKMALGIIVTDMDGSRISFGKASGRHFAKYISGLTLGIGYLMAGFTDRKQALHDMISDCFVVNKNLY